MSNYEKLNRETFLRKRRNEHFEAKRAWERAGKPPGVVLMEPGVEVICDMCSERIPTEDNVYLLKRTDWALCSRCAGVKSQAV